MSGEDDFFSVPLSCNYSAISIICSSANVLHPKKCPTILKTIELLGGLHGADLQNFIGLS